MAELRHTLAYRIVHGSVQNALDGHPDWSVPKSFARSVAKRAAGTLMAHNAPEALAAARRSSKRDLLYAKGIAGRAGAASTPALLSALKTALEAEVGKAHRAGDNGRFIDLCTALRIIKREIARGADG